MYEVTNINGATFIFSPFSNRETASLGVFLRIGSRFEHKKVKGIAHFLEHMLFKGSKNYSYRQIKQEIEGRGGSLNGFTSQEITAFYAQFLNKNIGLTLDILLDMVSVPILKVQDIEKERNVILEEIKMYNDLPSSRSAIILDQLLWPDHPLGEEVIGHSSTVKAIKQADLNDFNKKYYTPSNTVVVFSGNFSKEKIISLLKEKVKKDSRKLNLKATAPLPLRKLNIKTEKRSIEQTHLCLGFRSISYASPQRLTVQLINVILGANMSSRLFEELREKRSLCYDISTDLRKYKDSGAFLIHTSLDKSKILIAINIILKELNKIKEKEISRKELIRAKDYLLGQIAMSLERPGGRMFYLAENYITLGKIDTFDSIKKKVEAVTPCQIRDLAQQIFKFENICISCVGNVEDDLQERIRKAVYRE
jgi:predicted Zn-dependent peptidase